MKSFIGFFAVLITFAASAAPPMHEVEITKFYAPSGFDTNDNVQIQIVGTFPDNCYYKGPAKVEVSGKKVTVRQYAYKYRGTPEFCIQLKVPYTNTVDLGFLETADDYQIVESGKGTTLGVVTITDAPAPIEIPDSEPYAPVERAHIEKSGSGHVIKMVIPMDRGCQKLKSPMFVEVQNDQETILVKPVLEEDLGLTARCTGVTPYEHTEPIPGSLTGVWLLHVRAQSGQSINQLSVLD